MYSIPPRATTCDAGKLLPAPLYYRIQIRGDKTRRKFVIHTFIHRCGYLLAFRVKGAPLIHRKTGDDRIFSLLVYIVHKFHNEIFTKTVDNVDKTGDNSIFRIC